MIPRLILCPFACLSLSVVTGLPSPSAAHNGENTAFAIPLQEIAIDGRLHDWPADIEVYPVEWVSPFFYRETPPDGPEDFTGSFRVAYDRETSFLYVAVVVRDDELVFHPGEDIARTDACGIYVDADHSGGHNHSTASVFLHLDATGRKRVWEPTPAVRVAPQEQGAEFRAGPHLSDCGYDPGRLWKSRAGSVAPCGRQFDGKFRLWRASG